MTTPGEERPPVVLVTGASGSIGAATVACLRDRGCEVVTADRTPLPADVAGRGATQVTVDLTADADVETAFDRIPVVGPLRHVVAVAGGGDTEELTSPDQPTEPLEVFSRAVANNLHIAFITVRNAVPLLRRSGGDRSISLVGSINAYGGYGAPGYSAAKAGLTGLTRALAAPLGADGIRINCVALGTVDTANLHRLAAERGRELDLAAVAARTPLGRVLAPQEVALALVSVALDWPGLTGSTIVLDNGQTLIR
ncbi:MAG: SDR family NAD(P)-dependent oxidoreductase [Jiangellaceae bacterium]|jgi:NAD(P)-dependent dehydrogenase (short-subunit alcohol dehydrogenase family)